MRKPTFWFSTWSDTNQVVQLKKMATGLKFQIKKEEGLYYVAKTKALISFAVTANPICVFVFAYANCWFSHDAAQLFIFCIPVAGVDAVFDLYLKTSNKYAVIRNW